MHLHCLVVTFGYMKQTGCYKSFLQLAATACHTCFRYTEQSLGSRSSQAALRLEVCWYYQSTGRAQGCDVTSSATVRLSSSKRDSPAASPSASDPAESSVSMVTMHRIVSRRPLRYSRMSSPTASKQHRCSTETDVRFQRPFSCSSDIYCTSCK